MSIIPEGTWRARANLEGVKWGESTNGHPQVSVPFRFTGDDPHRGQTILWIETISTAMGLEIVSKNLATAGWTGVDIREPLVGLGSCEVDLVVVHETYVKRGAHAAGEEEKTVAKVRYVNALGGSAFGFKKPLVGKPLDRLAESIKKERLRAGVVATKATATDEDRGYYGSTSTNDDPDF